MAVTIAVTLAVTMVGALAVSVAAKGPPEQLAQAPTPKAAPTAADDGLAPPDELSVDFTVFEQVDDGGNPIRSEGLKYVGVRLFGKGPLTDEVKLGITASMAHLTNQAPEAALPPSIGAAVVTSVSADLFTLDALASFDISPKGINWTFHPGFFYHHQHRNVSWGADFAAKGAFNGGDTGLTLSYSLRLARTDPKNWDGFRPGQDWHVSNNFFASLTQTLSPAWLLSVSLQYTRQDGFLADAFNYVLITDEFGTPAKLLYEDMPRERNRGQGNVRLRWSPSVGWGIGLDASIYGDDWGVLVGSVSPSAVFSLSRTVRLRLWYRLALQQGSKYFSDSYVTKAPTFRTQDSDLASWALHSPGMSLNIPFGVADSRGPGFVARLSVYGYYRTDGIWTLGSSAGVSAKW